ncbi:MAG: hypothetical protein IJE29_02835 [Firmicutes bacterium]|nr:hypothetical protein [Bacillota bacterium]
MKTKNKVLLLMMCAVVLVAGSIFGTLAYLADNDAVTNTFTVGQVHMKLDEAKVEPDGAYVTDKSNRVTENEYHLIPGHTYIKDPTVHISDDSEDCYLFVKVENGIEDIETDEECRTIASQMERLDWAAVEGVDNVYVLAKGGADKYAVSGGADVVVFESFTIDGETVDNDKIAEYDTMQHETVIRVTAYAVQAAGFENQTPSEIWGAAFGADNGTDNGVKSLN